MKKLLLLNTIAIFLALNCFSQAGMLDPSFGFGGKVYTNLVDLNKADESANVVAVQPDGKIIIAGTTKTPAAVIRYNTDGSLDNSFDHDGMAFCFGFTINAISIQNDGKILIAGVSNNDFALIRFNVNGSLDNTFDGDGRLTTPIGTASDVAACMAIQDNGKIVLAGYSDNGSNTDFAVVRYNTNGSLDNSFDEDGKLVLAIGSSGDKAASIVLQNDGKLLVAGQSYTAGNSDFATVRLNNDGSLDNSFDEDGKVVTDINTTDESIKYISIQNDQKITVAGLTGANINYQDIIVCRYNIDGSLDNGFDNDGKLAITNSFLLRIYSMIIRADGKITLAGTDYNGASYFDFALAQLNAHGSLDNSFDNDGKLITAVGPAYDQVNAIAIQSDGKIVAVGKAETTGGTWDNFALARYNADGSPDNNFDSDGIVTTDIPSSDDHVRCMAVQADGKIVVAGYSYTNITGSTTNNQRFTLSRYNTDGTLDITFDGDGRVMTNFGGAENHITSIAIQSDGKIVVAGDDLAQDYDFALVRYNTDGSLDNSFGGDGKVTTSFSPRQDGAGALVIQSDGKIIAGGTSFDNYNNNNFAIARFNIDGSLDNSFDGDGKLILAIGPGTASDQITSMAIQSDGKILAAGSSYNGNDVDIALVRLNTNGSLDNTFDSDGIVTTDMGSLNNSAGSIVIQNDGKIVVGGNRQTGTINDFALVRYNTDGSLDNTFDGDGVVITDVNSGNDVLRSVVIQNNGKIIAGGYSNNGSNDDFTLVRYNANGTLDNTFDGDGKGIYDLETGNSERGYAIRLHANRIYLAGDIPTAGRSDFALIAVLNDILLSPLPLRLLEFSGKLQTNDAVLNWKTENELNTSAFIVERSEDGRNYIPVGTVQAKNTTGINYYNFIDYNAGMTTSTVLYYRLKQKDIDGGFTYSRIIALPLDKNKNIVLFYPNPVINEVNIALTVNRQDKLQVRIIDNNGRIIKQQQWNVTTGSTSLSIDVKNIIAGMYYLEIKGESIDYKKQFVK